jgi:diguanylate cyclase (GGDEF)-like protein
MHSPPKSPAELPMNGAVPRLHAVTAPAEPAGGLSLEAGLRILTRSFAEQVAAQTALLVAFAEDDDVARGRASWGLSTEAAAIVVRRGEGTAGRPLQGGNAVTYALHPSRKDPIGDAGGGRRIVSVLGAPVRSAVGVAGALYAGFSRELGDEPDLLWTAESYAGVASLCLAGSGLLGALTDAAGRDQLTGCLNYGALREAIGHEISRSERHGDPLACCFLDLDGFKRVNDTRGHLVGNSVLAAVGAALREGIRGSDLVGRWGGDEFVLVLPETSKPVAMLLAQRLRREIARGGRATIGEPIGASVGVSEWTPGCTTDALLDEADHSLRIAKEAGGGVLAAPAASETPRWPRDQSQPPTRALSSSDGHRHLLAIRRLLRKRRAAGGR